MGEIPSVNETSEKLVAGEGLDQICHALLYIIAAAAEAEADEKTPLLLAKWDIKDGFWCIVT